MTDRELRDASDRMHAALRRLPMPDPPGRRPRPAAIALAAAAAVLLMVGGWALLVPGSQERLDAAASTTAAPPPPCPVTTPSGGFVPPEPWPAQAPNDGGWHGTADLWTALPAGGQRQLLASGDKYFWWSRHFDVGAEPEPAITVTARRLDGQAEDVVEARATNGSRFDMGSFMLVGVELPTGGCWEITGEYRGATLTYVAEVLGGQTG